jgi:hypothetical protein
LTGILVATSMSKELVHTSQEVVQADAAHTYFGKYTLFSAYTSLANGNMVNLAFELLFGNEDLRNWNHFWTFVKDVHPSVNAPHYTILTDQDKGSINTIRGHLPQAFNFHCSNHRRQNIIKTCGGAAETAHTCLWTHNLLSGCNSLKWLESVKKEYLPHMDEKSQYYITKIDDSRQFAAVRCAMGANICMYGRSASSSVESMNRENKIVCSKTAVDVLR